MVDLTGFGLSAAINTGIAVVVLALFCMARMRRGNRFVYAPRTLHPAFRQGRPPPPPLSSTYIGFIFEVLQVPRATFIATAGLDAYMFLRWMELCCVMFAGMTVLGVGVLVPVNYTANGGQPGFDAISMSNLPSNSSRLAAHLIVSYLFAAWTYFLLYRLWLEYSDLRVAFLAREQLSNRRLTLLVENIPAAQRNDQAFLKAFQAFFPEPGSGSSSASALLSPSSRALLRQDDARSTSAVPHFIHSAYVCKDTKEMAEAVVTRDADLHSLEGAVLAYQQKPDERPMTATKMFCLQKRDALVWFEEDIRKQEQLMEDGRAAVEQGVDRGYSNGFLTFDSVVAYQSAVRVELTSEPVEWTCKPAPELRDVYWPSMAYTQAKRLYMGVLVSVLLALLVLLWVLPVTFIQGIANLSNLPNAGGAFGAAFSWINDIPSVPLGIIDGFLPGLVLTVFNILLPMMLYKLSKMQGIQAWSWLQGSVISKFTIFQVVNNFFFSTASTAILADLGAVTSDPSGLVTTLANNIPTTGTFFITYLLFTTLAVYPMALLNPGGLIVGRLKKRFLMHTPRDLVAIEAAPPRDYGTAYPITLFTFIIAISFSVLASISLPFATLYFALGYFVAKYNHLYVYNTHFETGGQLWPVVFRAMTWCIFIAQLVFTILLGLKKATAPAIISAPLVVLPWLFSHFVHRHLLPRTQVLPRDAAVAVDVEREKRRVKGLRGGASATAFLDDSGAVRDFGYSVDDIRACREEDIVYPHSACTQQRTLEYHVQQLSLQTKGGGGAGRGAPEEAKEQRSGDADAGGEADERMEVGGSNGTSSRAGSFVRPAGAMHIDVGDGAADAADGVGPVERSSSGGAARGGAGGLRGRLYRRQSGLLLQQTLQGGEALGALPLPLDYVQPELVAPAHLPIPRSIGAVQPVDSVDTNPQLIDELSWEALQRHSLDANGKAQQPREGHGQGRGGAAAAAASQSSAQQRNPHGDPLPSVDSQQQASSAAPTDDAPQVTVHL